MVKSKCGALGTEMVKVFIMLASSRRESPTNMHDPSSRRESPLKMHDVDDNNNHSGRKQMQRKPYHAAGGIKLKALLSHVACSYFKKLGPYECRSKKEMKEINVKLEGHNNSSMSESRNFGIHGRQSATEPHGGINNNHGSSSSRVRMKPSPELNNEQGLSSSDGMRARNDSDMQALEGKLPITMDKTNASKKGRGRSSLLEAGKVNVNSNHQSNLNKQINEVETKVRDLENKQLDLIPSIHQTREHMERSITSSIEQTQGDIERSFISSIEQVRENIVELVPKYEEKANNILIELEKRLVTLENSGGQKFEHETKTLFEATVEIHRLKRKLSCFVVNNSTSALGHIMERGSDNDDIPTPIVVIEQDLDPTAMVITFGDQLGALLDTMNALRDLGLNVIKEIASTYSNDVSHTITEQTHSAMDIIQTHRSIRGHIVSTVAQCQHSLLDHRL
eukprot:Gb_34199 [translate_table: standard]